MSLTMLKGNSKNNIMITLKKQAEVIRAVEESGVGAKKVAEKFNCGINFFEE